MIYVYYLIKICTTQISKEMYYMLDKIKTHRLIKLSGLVFNLLVLNLFFFKNSLLELYIKLGQKSSLRKYIKGIHENKLSNYKLVVRVVGALFSKNNKKSCYRYLSCSK